MHYSLIQRTFILENCTKKNSMKIVAANLQYGFSVVFQFPSKSGMSERDGGD
jgi:hypothetical protein